MPRIQSISRTCAKTAQLVLILFITLLLTTARLKCFSIPSIYLLKCYRYNFLGCNDNFLQSASNQIFDLLRCCIKNFVQRQTSEGIKDLILIRLNFLCHFRKTQNESAEEEQELSEVFMKTLNYTSRFSKFKNRETISAIRR